MVKVITDSTSYIPKEYIEEYDISIISLNVIINGVTKKEVDVVNEDFYKEMDASDEMPTSSQPAPDELYQLFEQHVKNNDEVLAIFLSSELSGTFSSSHMIKNMILENYPEAKIEILDSRTTCMQMGFAVVEAAVAAKEGKSFEDVIQRAKYVIDHSRFLFTPHNLDYLKKGGRIGRASALLGGILQIRPVLTVVDGKTDILTKVRTNKKAVDAIIDTFLEDVKEKGLGDVIVHHINYPEGGQILADRIKEALDVDVKMQSIGPIVGLHVGPKSIGISYFTK